MLGGQSEDDAPPVHAYPPSLSLPQPWDPMPPYLPQKQCPTFMLWGQGDAGLAPWHWGLPTPPGTGTGPWPIAARDSLFPGAFSIPLQQRP